MRGILTEAVQAVAVESLGREITSAELRLMPYLHYQLMNNRRIDINRINNIERGILSEWRNNGWIEGGAGSDLYCTHEFWKAMNDILFVSYVNV